MKQVKRISILIGIAAALVAVPAASAQPVDNGPGGSGGCTYTDKDGYDIPIDDNQTVFVDGKLVTCKGGTVIVTNPPRTQTNPKGGVKKPPHKVARAKTRAVAQR